MRGLLVCAIVLALGLVNADSPCVCHYGNYRSARSSAHSKINQQDLQISRLSARIQDLQAKIDNGKSKRDEIVKQQHILHDRVDELEGSHCPSKKEFYCGPTDGHCVSNLLVCDKVKDCESGHDEETARCTNPVPSGTTFKAVIHQKNSCTRRKLNSISFTVTSERQYTWYPSINHLEFDVTLDHTDGDAHKIDTLHAYGYYAFSDTQLVIQPPEDDRLGLVCEFNLGEPDACYGAVVREATLDRCLEFYATREH